MTDDPMMNDHLWALGHFCNDWGPLPEVSGEAWRWLLEQGYIERNDMPARQIRLTDKGRAILRVRTPGPAALAAMSNSSDAPSLREPGYDLLTILRALYDSEINCGFQSFWDGGWTVWLGDHLNGHRAANEFHDTQHPDHFAGLGVAAGWLRAQAMRLYPDSDFARAQQDSRKDGSSPKEAAPPIPTED